MPTSEVNVETMTVDQLVFVGRLARRLLGDGIDRGQWTNFLNEPLRKVCWTVATDPDESLRLISRFLEPAMLTQEGHRYLPTIAHFISELAAVNEDFALKAIEAIGNTSATRDDAVPMGSRVMPLTTNKHDMLSGALLTISNEFPELIKNQYEFGFRAMKALFDAHVRTSESHYAEPREPYNVEIAGGAARYTPDGSYVWASGERGSSEHQTWFKVGHAFCTETLRKLRADELEVADLLRMFREHGGSGLMWRHLLEIVQCCPKKSLGAYEALFTSRPILVCIETQSAAAKVLTKRYGQFSSESRERIERTILDVPNWDESYRDHEDLARERDRLLGCINLAFFALAEAKQLRVSNDAANQTPTVHPPIRLEPGYGDGRLPWERGEDANLGSCSRGFKQRLATYQNLARQHETIESDATGTYFEHLKCLNAEIQQAEFDGVLQDVIGVARRYEVQMATALARSVKPSESESTLQNLREVLVQNTNHPEPVKNPNTERYWDERRPSWGTGLMRIEVAEGLVHLCRHKDQVDGDLLLAIQSLSHDAHPAVRHQVYSNLRCLWNHANPLFWEIFEFAMNEEARTGLVRHVIESVPLCVPLEHDERVRVLVANVGERIGELNNGECIREQIARFHFSRAISNVSSIHDETDKFLDAVIADPSKYSVELENIIRGSREYLVATDSKYSEDENRAVRRWMASFLRRVFVSANTKFRKFVEDNQGRVEPLDESEANIARSLISLQSSIVNQVYLASGAYDDQKYSTTQSPSNFNNRRNKAELICEDGWELVDAISDTPSCDPAYHVLQTLRHLRVIRPEESFLLVERVVHAGTLDGANLEPLIVDEYVRIVEDYLVEHRSLFRTSKRFRDALMASLDQFVNVGWPKAMQLTHQLDEAIRG